MILGAEPNLCTASAEVGGLLRVNKDKNHAHSTFVCTLVLIFWFCFGNYLPQQPPAVVYIT